jgi:hypothetical protein
MVGLVAEQLPLLLENQQGLEDWALQVKVIMVVALSYPEAGEMVPEGAVRVELVPTKLGQALMVELV